MGKIKQINTDKIKRHIRHNYGGADVWLNEIQVMGNGRILGQKGRDYFKEKIELHRKWMKKHPKREAAAV